MSTDTLVRELKATKDYFDRSTRCLEEKHAGFTPAEGSMNGAQQIAHVAQTVDWFLEGAFGKGFDMDFEGHIASVMKVQTLADARAWLDRAFDAATEKIGSCSAEEIQKALPEGPIMGGQPRADIVGSIVDHTAHHRGALTVYARLQGLTPAMPYMETAPS